MANNFIDLPWFIRDQIYELLLQDIHIRPIIRTSPLNSCSPPAPQQEEQHPRRRHSSSASSQKSQSSLQLKNDCVNNNDSLSIFRTCKSLSQDSHKYLFKHATIFVRSSYEFDTVLELLRRYHLKQDGRGGERRTTRYVRSFGFDLSNFRFGDRYEASSFVSRTLVSPSEEQGGGQDTSAEGLTPIVSTSFAVDASSSPSSSSPPTAASSPSSIEQDVLSTSASSSSSATTPSTSPSAMQSDPNSHHIMTTIEDDNNDNYTTLHDCTQLSWKSFSRIFPNLKTLHLFGPEEVSSGDILRCQDSFSYLISSGLVSSLNEQQSSYQKRQNRTTEEEQPDHHHHLDTIIRTKSRETCWFGNAWGIKIPLYNLAEMSMKLIYTAGPGYVEYLKSKARMSGVELIYHVKFVCGCDPRLQQEEIVGTMSTKDWLLRINYNGKAIVIPQMRT